MHVKASIHLKMEQSFKARCIINDEFHNLELVCTRNSGAHANASKAKRVDPDTAKAKDPFNHQALESWTRSNDVVHGMLRDEDLFESELFKMWELKALDGAVRKLAMRDGGDTEGCGEPENG